ncbi:TOBE domain-containing protein [uncultured Arcticibacterium sp.]|uniref:TOBE domain-containing protein n=1 Tax=uncultured Arcticibacterium sp. TaxID=2173042 RepID=UPI0030F5B003
MNSFSGQIDQIESSGNISIVSVRIGEGVVIKSVIIDTEETAPYLAKATAVKTLFKETEVILSLEENPSISLQNKISGTIIALEQGALLSRIEVQTLYGNLVSIISSNAVKTLKLDVGTQVTAMIKLNEITLAP